MEFRLGHRDQVGSHLRRSSLRLNVLGKEQMGRTGNCRQADRVVLPSSQHGTDFTATDGDSSASAMRDGVKTNGKPFLKTILQCGRRKKSSFPSMTQIQNRKKGGGVSHSLSFAGGRGMSWNPPDSNVCGRKRYVSILGYIFTCLSD